VTTHNSPAGRAILLPHHRKQLRESAISDEVANERGYQTVSRDSNATTASRDRLKRCGIPGWARKEPARYPGLLIPLYRATGERIAWQYRPDNPPTVEGKVRKYAAQVGRASVLDVHPFNRDRIVDPSVPLWITEGVKKGDALTSFGACVVTLAGVFNWRSRLASLGDWEDVLLRGREIIVCFDADAETNPNVASAMARLGAWLKSKGAGVVRYVVTPAQINGTATKGADDFLAAGGTLEQLLAAASSKPPDPRTLDAEFSDARLAEVLADEVLADRFCWAGSGMGWMGWDGVRWKSAEVASVHEAVRLYFLDLFTRETAAGADKNRQSALYSLLGRGRITAIVELARGLLLQEPGEFDQHPDLLNTPTGVVDLTTKQLIPHDPALLMTKVTAVGYEPGAEHPDWKTALQALPDGVRDWVQVRMGQAVTGHMTPDDALLVCQGGGENGKTTMFGTAARSLGGYYVLVSDRVLLANPNAHPTELMELRGARLALIEETPEARRLDVARLKKVVGTPQIEARHIHKNSVTFNVTHSLFLSTNYRPLVEETDHGTWRRLKLVRFPYRFRPDPLPLENENDRRGDPALRERMLADEGAQRAALAWLVEGAYRWYAAGQVFPAVPGDVAADTQTWRAESDVLLGYLEDSVVADPAAHVMASELFQDFNAWLTQHGHKPWSDKTFSARLEAYESGTAIRVRRGRKREAEGGLSRRPDVFAATDPPKQYRAWIGLRFRTESDDLREAVEAVEASGNSSVTDVTAKNKSALVSSSRGNLISAVTSVTAQFSEGEAADGQPIWRRRCDVCGERLDAISPHQRAHPECNPAAA